MHLENVASHLLDLTQNAIDAGADRITVTVLLKRRSVSMRLRDNGCGMTESETRKALTPGFSTKPFSRGMGLPLAKRTAERFAIRSKKGRGTTVTARFSLKTLPAGDVKGFLNLLEQVNPSVHFCVRVREHAAR